MVAKEVVVEKNEECGTPFPELHLYDNIPFYLMHGNQTHIRQVSI